MCKGNDINVGSIEEDIERLEEISKCFTYSMWSEDTSALKRFLQDYTRQKQINEQQQKINGELREKVKQLKDKYILEKVAKEEVEELLEDSIPRQKIIDKVEEIEKEYELLLEHQSGKDSNRTKYIRGKLHMGQELLQESEEK